MSILGNGSTCTEGDVDGVSTLVTSLGGTVLEIAPQSPDAFRSITAQVPTKALPSIAAHDDVRWIDAVHEPVIEDERSSQIVFEDLNATPAPNTLPNTGYAANLTGLGVDGTGVTIAVCDTGIDTNDPMTVHADLAGRLAFVTAETARLSRLVGDYQQVELFRQKLVKADTVPVSLAAVAGQVVEDDLVAYRRLPQFSVSSTVPADLAPARADADLLRRAIASIIAMAAQRSGQGAVTISARQDTDQWLVLTITGSAFSGPAQPSDAMLDESRQFMTRLAAVDTTTDAAGGELVGLVLARVIVEFYGGSLAVSAGEPGFIVRLPAAV